MTTESLVRLAIIKRPACRSNKWLMLSTVGQLCEKAGKRLPQPETVLKYGRKIIAKEKNT